MSKTIPDGAAGPVRFAEASNIIRLPPHVGALYGSLGLDKKLIVPMYERPNRWKRFWAWFLFGFVWHDKEP